MYHLLRSILFKTTDPERIHNIAMKMLARTPMAKILTLGKTPPRKTVSLWGFVFRNPIGLAAGFDKDAEAIEAWKQLGFGFVEVGTITPKPQTGNPKPRIFRIPEQKAIINRMGFPNQGVDAAIENLKKYRSNHHELDFPIGINIGKGIDTPIEEAYQDYLECFQKLYDFGEFFVVNISSPNTPGLRTLQQPELLDNILRTLQEFNRANKNKPLLVKIVIDFTPEQVVQILDVATRNEVSGIVTSNTSLDHTGIKLQEKGGLSGAPIRKKSTEMIHFIHQQTGGKLPIIGCGGVFTKDDFQEKLDAGAALVQLYTGFIYEGPLVVHKILK